MVSRRLFVVSSVAASAACTLGRSARRDVRAAAIARPPQLGQDWRYSKRDRLTGMLIGTESHRVSAVSDAIEIEITSEAHAQDHVREYWDPFSLLSHERSAAPARRLPGEIQKPWGKVAVEPHWSETLAFQQAIPLWPTALQAGWSTRVRTDYLTPDSKGLRAWELSMHAHDWESISTPAGRFTALRFTNLIDFVSTDIFRRSSQRRETIWFVPEIGRWAVRENSGLYYHEDSVDDQPLNEAAYRWELQSWT